MSFKKWLKGQEEEQETANSEMCFECLEQRIVFDAAVQAVPDAGHAQAAQDQTPAQDGQSTDSSLEAHVGQTPSGDPSHAASDGLAADTQQLDKAADSLLAEHIDHAVLTPVGEAMENADGITVLKGSVDLDGDGNLDGTFVSATHTSGKDTVTESHFTLTVEGHQVDYSVIKVATDADSDGNAERVHEEGTGADGHKVFSNDAYFDSQGHMQSTDHSTYDDAGHVIAKDHITYDFSGQESGKDHSEYQYDQQGHLISQDDTHYDSSGEITAKDHTEHKYDAQGHMSESFHTSYDADNAVQGTDHTAYLYDHDGHMTAQDTSYFGADGHLTSTTHTLYDAQGHMTDMDQTTYDQAGHVTATDHRTYDADGHMVTSDHMEYNARGAMVSKIHTVYDSEGNVLSVDQTSYNARGILTGTTHTAYDAGSHAAHSDITTYDVLGRILHTRHVDFTDPLAGQMMDSVDSRASTLVAGTYGYVSTANFPPSEVTGEVSGATYSATGYSNGNITEVTGYKNGAAVDKDTFTYYWTGYAYATQKHIDWNLVNGKWVEATVWVYNQGTYGLKDCYTKTYNSKGNLTNYTDWNFQTSGLYKGSPSSWATISYDGNSAGTTYVDPKSAEPWLSWRGEKIPSGTVIKTEFKNFMSYDEKDDHEIRQLYNNGYTKKWVVWSEQGTSGTCGPLAAMNVLESAKATAYDHYDFAKWAQGTSNPMPNDSGHTLWNASSGSNYLDVAKMVQLNGVTAKAYSTGVPELGVSDNHLEFSQVFNYLKQGKQVIVGIEAGDIKWPTSATAAASWGICGAVTDTNPNKLTGGHFVVVNGVELDSRGNIKDVVVTNGWTKTPGLTKVDYKAFLYAWAQAQKAVVICG